MVSKQTKNPETYPIQPRRDGHNIAEREPADRGLQPIYNQYTCASCTIHTYQLNTIRKNNRNDTVAAIDYKAKQRLEGWSQGGIMGIESHKHCWHHAPIYLAS
jgi:hypothetical protein